MRAIPFSSLIVSPERQRREFSEEALLELQDSIEKFGLMHPIVIREGNKLVAGERRLRAMQAIWELDAGVTCNNIDLEPFQVPVVDLGELSEIEAFEAELDENIRRTDLSWQERAAAILRLHTLREMQAKARGESHTVAATAREVTGSSVGDYQTKINEALIVARNLSNPAVSKAKDVKEALKILKRDEEATRNIKLSQAIGRTYSSSAHTFLWGDCIQTMHEMTPASFDIICTDPPYGMGADDFGDAAGKMTGITHAYEDSLDSFKALMQCAAVCLDRVAKPAAHLYLCCDIDQFPFLKVLFSEIGGWNVFRTPLINVKEGGRVPLPEHGPRRQYETILYAYRGGKQCTAIYPDVITTKGDENLGHGAQKPVELYVNLLKRSARPGDHVLDPFAGTGTIFPAAHALMLFATGIEMEAAYYGIGVKRIEGLGDGSPS